MQVKEINDSIGQLLEQTQYFHLDIEAVVREMECLDDETLRRLQNYQKHRHIATIAFSRAVKAKQKAIHLGRRLSRLDTRFSNLCSQYKTLGTTLRDGIASGVIKDSETRKLLDELKKVQCLLKAVRQTALEWRVASFGKDNDEIEKIL